MTSSKTDFGVLYGPLQVGISGRNKSQRWCLFFLHMEDDFFKSSIKNRTRMQKAHTSRKKMSMFDGQIQHRISTTMLILV